MSSQSDKQKLRDALREQRKQLTPSCREEAALALAQQLAQLIPSYQKIAYYWPLQNEMDPRPLMQTLKGPHYLPVIASDSLQLKFYPYEPGDPLQPNRFGILEPTISRKTPITPEELDIVLVPLLGFDLKGSRLGMGGGYYDYNFSFLKNNLQPKPLLIGLGFEFQKLADIPEDPWDIHLHWVATESRVYQF